VLELSDGLRNVFRLRRYWREGLEFFERALAAAVALADVRAQGWNMYRLADLHYALGTRGYRAAAEWADAARAAFRRAQPPDLRGLGHATRVLGRAAREQGDFSAAWRLLGEALALLSAHGQKGDVAITQASQADLLRKQGRLDEAEALYRQVLPPDLAGDPARRASVLADPATLANVLHNLGDIALRRQQLRAAEIWFEHGRQAATEAGARQFMADCLAGLAQVARARGEHDRAERLAEEAREVVDG
jgi:tetratricopeptide (TPR) repeat protein